MRIARSHTAYAIVALGAHVAMAGESAQLLAPLKDPHIDIGCGWRVTFQPLGEKGVLVAEDDVDRSEVWMNLGGDDIKLKVVGKTGRAVKRGDVLREIYKAEGVEVIATYTVTWDCSMSSNEDCEATWYDARFEVKVGNATQVLLATGGFGC